MHWLVLKERWALGKISEEMYEEFIPQYKEQVKGIEKELEKISQDSSNLEKDLQTTLEGAANLVSTWKILDYIERQRLQYLIFPKGMFYDRKNDEVRTDEVNSIFTHIAYLNKVSGQNETGQSNNQVDLSDQVGQTGFEPATPTSRT